MTAQQISFVKNSLQAAVSAGASFNMNPTVILAQAAFESGWGMSKLATGSNNYFGLTAYGCRLIRNNYRTAWQASNNPEAYAREIAYSPYISELNGDDRETYRRSLVQMEKTVRAIVEIII